MSRHSRSGAHIDQPTVVSRLTPAGRGAVATLALVGPGATDAIAACFQSAREQHPRRFQIGRIYFGMWRAAAPSTISSRILGGHAAVGEELVVCRTAPDSWEVHCHGGYAAANAICDSLVQLGCRPCAWPTLLRWQASSRRSQSAWQVDARIALAEATTQRTALILLDQLNGALDRDFRQAVADRRHGRLNQCRQQLKRLLDYAPLGRHLTQPWKVVLAGPPNVGKSSLINALVGFQRTVTFDQPGTTRDVVRVRTAMEGWPLELRDTAGLRDSQEPLEQLGVERARAQINDSDLTLLVFAADQWNADQAIGTLAKFPGSLIVINKCDLWQQPHPHLGKLGSAEPVNPIAVSALTGHGLAELAQQVCRRLVPEPPPSGAGVPFLKKHVAALNAALAEAS